MSDDQVQLSTCGKMCLSLHSVSVETLISEGRLDEVISHIQQYIDQVQDTSQILVTVMKYYSRLVAKWCSELQMPVWKIYNELSQTEHKRDKVLELVALLMKFGADANGHIKLEECSELLSVLQKYENDLFECISVGHSSEMSTSTCWGLAVLISDVQLLELTITSATDVNSVCYGDMTAIVLSMNRNSAVTKLLVEKGANIFLALPVCRLDDWGMPQPPFLQAVHFNNLYLAKVLLELDEGAKTLVLHGGESPLHIHVAASKDRGNGCTEMIDLLLRYGADINKYNNSRITPLGLALKHRCFQAAEHLLKCFCDRNKNTLIQELGEMHHPLYVACFYGLTHLLHYWLPIDCVCFYKRSLTSCRQTERTWKEAEISLLMKEQNSASIVKNELICEHEVYLMADSEGLTPFLMAVMGGNLRAIQHLVSFGMDPYACCERGNAVHLAVLTLELDVLEYVIKLGCDIDQVNKQGNSPLHLAARTKHQGLCLELITSGANLNVLDKHGETPLSVSVYFGNYKTSVLLICHGADLHIADSRGTTPFYWSVFNCRTATLQKLVEAGVHCSAANLKRYPRNLKIMRNLKLMEWLQNEIRHPKTLFQCCVLKLRELLKTKVMGTSIYSSIESLPLPRTLKDRIKLI